ncbi:MAG: hypothetical protein CAPSK01_002858 [Candidatus Accumulibacter vicinus]|uniref:Uncharacterized protein n=1 Tax=Candidatus Accumulibacter vicinus TaxID=2954382 RepID=A0A084XZ49_9PROT|nr:MAG: hypothetical protein CAPSK01_002858 [Candidatus Accumulibacter vicinus]
MRHQQHVTAQQGSGPIEQGLLVACLDVGGEQDAGKGILDPQHATHVVGPGGLVLVSSDFGMQDRETNAVPLPGLPGLTTFAGQFGKRRQGTHDRHRLLHGYDATRVVLVAMGHDQRIERLDSAGAQVGNDDALAGVRFGAVQRPGVVEKIVFGGTHDNRQSLTDVKHIDPGLSRQGPLGWCKQHWQQQTQAQPASRETAWQK